MSCPVVFTVICFIVTCSRYIDRYECTFIVCTLWCITHLLNYQNQSLPGPSGFCSISCFRPLYDCYCASMSAYCYTGDKLVQLIEHVSSSYITYACLDVGQLHSRNVNQVTITQAICQLQLQSHVETTTNVNECQIIEWRRERTE